MILRRVTVQSVAADVYISSPIQCRLIAVRRKNGEVPSSRLAFTTSSTTNLSPEDQKALMRWPYVYRIPIFAADSVNKGIHVNEWSTCDFSKTDFRKEMLEGKYDNGAAARLGLTLEGGLYSVTLDFDGWDAVVAWFESWERVVALAQKTLVEWHQDKGKIHILIFTKEPLQNKKIHIGPNKILLEIRCDKQPLFISPSRHKDGNKYCPLGVDRIEVLDDVGLMKLKGQINLLSDKYMSDEDKSKYDAWLDNPDTILGEGAGRHDATKFKICSYYWKHTDEWLNLSDDERFERAWQWHMTHCRPPRSRQEFDRICEWTANNHKSKRDAVFNRIREEKRRREQQNLQHELADYPGELMRDFTLKTLRDTGEIWYYNEERGVFLPGAETIIATRIELDLGHPWIDKDGKIHESRLTTHKVKEYIDHIRRRTYIDREQFNPSTEWLASKNCMVNLLTGETNEFSPDFLCTTQIPIVYDNGYETNQIADFFRLVEDRRGKIMRFLYEIMRPDDVQLFLDFLAYCLWRQYKFNFWLLLHGAGFNGKSILLNLIDAFLGKNNVSGETLDRLLHEKFAVAQLYGKMANVDADVSADVIFNNTGILKKLTGNDLHTGEEKFKPPFKFVNFAKLIFSCNKIPETEDQTDAFFRRLIIINLTTQFFGDKEDFDLIKKLTTEEELTLLLHEILSRLPRILREGLRKTTNESIAENYDKYTKGSNPVKAFYEKAIGPEVGGRIPKVEMLEHYHRFFREFGLTPESDQSFSRKLSEDFKLKSKQFRTGSERIYCWLDVKLRNWTLEQEEADKTIQDLNDFSSETKEVMR